MALLSLFRRIAVFAPGVLCLTVAVSAAAQVPVFTPAEPEPPPPPAEAPALAPAPVLAPAPAAAPAPVATPLPPAPTAPPGPAPAPAASSAPLPAKTDHLAEPEAEEEPLDDDVEPDDVDDGPRRRWYGWQTLTADAASILMIVAGASLETQQASGASSTLVAMGVIGYEFAPGIVHFAHGNTGRGFGSFGMRLGMPLAGAFIGASAASGCDGFLCEAGGAAVGLLIGMGGAIAIDAAVFAYDDPRGRASEDAGLTPLLVLAPQSAWLGLGGKL